MSNGPWTDAENDLIVADYFAMLAADVAGQPYNKAEHNRDLQARIDRNRSSIEFKHQNISAALQGLGETWIREAEDHAIGPGDAPAPGECRRTLVEMRLQRRREGLHFRPQPRQSAIEASAEETTPPAAPVRA